ncbi:MAG TPA: hypothetical protein VF981_14145 [Gemmatimonadaceae bacterium]
MTWTALWLAWIAMFAVIEWRAIVNDTKGDTLSEHFRRWFRVDTHAGRTVWLVTSGVFFAWFVTHLWGGA